MNRDQIIKKYNDACNEGWRCLVEAETIAAAVSPTMIDWRDKRYSKKCLDALAFFHEAQEWIGIKLGEQEQTVQKIRWGRAMCYFMLGEIEFAHDEMDEAVKNVEDRDFNEEMEERIKTERDRDIAIDAIFFVELNFGAFLSEEEGEVESRFRKSVITEFYLLFLRVCVERGIMSVPLMDRYRKKLEPSLSMEEFEKFLEERLTNE